MQAIFGLLIFAWLLGLMVHASVRLLRRGSLGLPDSGRHFLPDCRGAWHRRLVWGVVI